MSRKMMSPNTRLDFIPEDAVDALGEAYDPEAPKAEFFTDATNLSCAVVAGYTLNPAKSTTDSTKSICDEATVENPASVNYEGMFTFFREGDPLDTTSAYSRAFAEFRTGGKRGYWVRRTGKKNMVPVTAGDTVSSFLFESDEPKDVLADDAPIQFSAKMLQQASMSLFKTVIA